MEEVGVAGESGGGACCSRKAADRGAATSFEVAGGRQRFTVELRPGETTIVSWKKLLKDAGLSKPKGVDIGSGAKPVASSSSAQVNSNNPHSYPHLPHPSLDARFPSVSANFNFFFHSELGRITVFFGGVYWCVYFFSQGASWRT